MSRIPALIAVLPLLASETHEECRRRIEQLEERLAKLEAVVQPRPPDLPPAPTAPPAPLAARPRMEMPPELVPEIGKIGAEVGLLLSGSSSPFRLGRGTFAAGFIDLPLFESQRLRGKIGYEILVGQSQSHTTFSTTSNVAQVANLAVLTALNPAGGLNNVASAVTGTGPAPFPVTTSTLTRLRVLQVVPFALKYTSTALDRWRIRPYGVLGFGMFVTIHNQNPARGAPPSFGIRTDAALPPEVLAVVSQVYGGRAPFGGPLVAGQISQAPELEARGLPGGHGNIDLGIHSGLGFEFRIFRGFSLGFDGRFNRVAGTNGYFQTYGSRVGFHF
ncbi:MAG: hypothetical protein ACRD96_22550 [Bryobacteraceae bacterium]